MARTAMMARTDRPKSRETDNKINAVQHAVLNEQGEQANSFHNTNRKLTKQHLNSRVYLGVRTCDIFPLFRWLVLGFDYCLMVSWLFCFLCFTSSVSLTCSYTEDKPNSQADEIGEKT